ncbi:MAG: F0F1 ATP synthase subunit epsilon [Candidatus Electryoneaceae bacterium]|nr:F0F1 ATP synthase subunit epsilon [Candidatus Electryoneaceae bacterium]
MADTTTNTFTVTIVTPFGTKEEYDVRHLRAPGTQGDFGVLPGHIPFMTTLRVGAVTLDTVDGSFEWATSGGYAEVLDDRVTILAETAERADSIDLQRAEEAKKRALVRLSEKTPNVDAKRARTSLMRALNRLTLASNSETK